MLKIGLTGNIGCGKSTIAHIFRVLGVPIFIADIEARKITMLPDVIRTLTTAFGIDLLDSSGIPDKKKLAEIVFGNPEKLAILNSIIHPAVRERFIQWCEYHQPEPYVIQEAAILYETGQNSIFDLMIVVSAPQEERIRRVMLRDGLTSEEVYKRIQSQWPEEKKTALADFIIFNDGKQLVIPQVMAVHNKLMLMAGNDSLTVH